MKSCKWKGKLAFYDKLIGTNPNFEKKGIIYQGASEYFIYSDGAVMKEYVLMPEKPLDDLICKITP